MATADKSHVVEHLHRLGTLLEYHGESVFRVRAFHTAADALDGEAASIAELVESPSRLEGIKGIGKSLAGVIREVARTGSSVTYTELMEKSPAGLFDLLRIPGVGVKKVRVLCELLSIQTLDDLERHAQAGDLGTIPGFGAKSAEKILAGIRTVRSSSGRYLRSDALAIARPILDMLRAHPAVQRCDMAGSLRRGRETVKDIDFVASSAQAGDVMELFVKQPGVVEVIGHGSTKSSVRFANGLQADLRVVPDEEYPSALTHFTGSKEHNVAMRKRALAQGLRLNEYGLFVDATAGSDADAAGRREQRIASSAAAAADGVTVSAATEAAARSGERLPITEEADLYKALGLHFVPPELREDRGELDFAAKGPFPALVGLTDYRGVLHCHSTWSDGEHSLREMVAAAKNLGWQYYGVGDHSQTAAYARGLSPERLLQQIEEVAQLNREFGSDHFAVLSGSESDILAEGELDFADELLVQLDYVVASVHSRFNASRVEQTARIVRAVEHPCTTILGHPSGRLLLRRDPYDFDLEAVFEAAVRTGTFIEINADPHRLDLDWRFLREAAERGVRFAINPDAHSVAGLHNVEHGIAMARKGGLEKRHILNCLPLEELREEIVALRTRKSKS